MQRPKKTSQSETKESGPSAKSSEFLGSYESAELFRNLNEITIIHNGHAYRLRQTKNGKLILNK